MPILVVSKDSSMYQRNVLIDALRKCFNRDRISMYYHGDFDDTFTDKLISLSEYDIAKKAKRRMAFLISESFQNIVRHGNSSLTGTADNLFGIRGIGAYLHIFSSNLVDENTKNFLGDKLSEINVLDKDQIKAYYKQALEESSFSDKGGAGLGLIEMARKSLNPIQTSFVPMGNGVYSYNMQVDLLVEDVPEEEISDDLLNIEENTALHELIIKENIVFLLKGNFSDDLVSPMLSVLEQNTNAKNDSVGFLIYHSAVELMQNITRHARLVNEKKEGIFFLTSTEKGYYLCTGNHIEGNGEAVMAHIDRLNTMDKAALNELYRSQLKASLKDESDHAGVGLIDIRRITMSPLEAKVGTDANGNYLVVGIEIPVA
jgi:hypothetical protein